MMKDVYLKSVDAIHVEWNVKYKLWRGGREKAYEAGGACLRSVDSGARAVWLVADVAFKLFG